MKAVRYVQPSCSAPEEAHANEFVLPPPGLVKAADATPPLLTRTNSANTDRVALNNYQTPGVGACCVIAWQTLTNQRSQLIARYVVPKWSFGREEQSPRHPAFSVSCEGAQDWNRQQFSNMSEQLHFKKMGDAWSAQSDHDLHEHLDHQATVVGTDEQRLLAFSLGAIVEQMNRVRGEICLGEFGWERIDAQTVVGRRRSLRTSFSSSARARTVTEGLQGRNVYRKCSQVR